tara:strand:+ start:4372 stop:5304 length:933 start_codon:yes stop_codon:yes gene_type:complete
MKWFSTFKKTSDEVVQNTVLEPNELARRVRAIEIRVRRVVENTLQGHYHAAFRGMGIEFDELRTYIPGDDIRAIDWKSWARTGQPLIRRYKEERDLTLLIAVDISNSLQFGASRMRKTELVAELTAVFALSAIRNNDQVGVVLFSGTPQRFIRPAKGPGHLLRIIREVLSARPTSQGTDIAGVLKYCNSIYRRKGVLLLISDFLDSNYERELRAANTRFDIVAICVRESLDRVLPNLGVVGLADAETNAVFEVDTSSKLVREKYMRRIQDLDHTRRKLFRELGIDEVEVAPGVDYLSSLLKFFQNRKDVI